MKHVIKFLFFSSFVAVCLLGNQLPASSAPDDFTLAWACDSYIPPDYPGKALPTAGSKIKVTAMPTKKLSYNPDLLNYRWFLDDDIMGWANGRGKSSLRFTATKETGYHVVELQALDSQETVVFRQTISILMSRPQMILKDSLTGYSLEENYLASTGQNLNFKAVPLFFPISNLSQLVFQWKVDNINVPIEEKDADWLKLTLPKGSLSSPLSKIIQISIHNRLDESVRASTSLNLEIR